MPIDFLPMHLVSLFWKLKDFLFLRKQRFQFLIISVPYLQTNGFLGDLDNPVHQTLWRKYNGRLQKTWTNNPALRLPQNSYPPLNHCTTCKMTYFTHPDTCSPFPEPATHWPFFFLLPPYLWTLLYHNCATYFRIHLGLFGASLWLNKGLSSLLRSIHFLSCLSLLPSLVWT
jgi:hypothetical protein